MGMSDGKLVPRHLAGWVTGPRTMQDDDNTSGGSGPIPPGETGLITINSLYITTIDGTYLVTE